MTEYDQSNRGAIWKNEKKTTDKHPDFTGSLNVDGREFRVSAWKREEGANPKAPALRFKVEPKDEQTISQRAMPERPDPISSGVGPAKRSFPGDNDMDDPIPF